jgi:hypothetical protein
MSSSYAMHKLLLGKLIFATVNQDLCMQCLKYNTNNIDKITKIYTFKTSFYSNLSTFEAWEKTNTVWCEHLKQEVLEWHLRGDLGVGVGRSSRSFQISCRDSPPREDILIPSCSLGVWPPMMDTIIIISVFYKKTVFYNTTCLCNYFD